MKISPEKKAKLKAAFNPELHPRYPAGHPQGGKFMPKGSKDYNLAVSEAKKTAKTKAIKPKTIQDQDEWESAISEQQKKKKTPSKSAKQQIDQNSPMDGEMLNDQPKKAAALAAKLTGVNEERGAQMADALNAFSYHHDFGIRQAQRNGEDYNYVNDGKGGDRHVDHNVVDALNEYLDKAPKYEGVISRGLNFPKKADGEAFLKQLQNAGGYTQRETSSFSADRGIAERYAQIGEHPISVVMHLDDNKSGVGMRRFSHFEDEREALSPAGARFKVKKIVQRPSEQKINYRGVYDVHLEEVEPEKIATRRAELKKQASTPSAIAKREFNKSERIKAMRLEIKAKQSLNKSAKEANEIAKEENLNKIAEGLANIAVKYEAKKMSGVGYEPIYHAQVEKAFEEIISIATGKSKQNTAHAHFGKDGSMQSALIVHGSYGKPSEMLYLITLPTNDPEKENGSGRLAIQKAYDDKYHALSVKTKSEREFKYFTSLGFAAEQPEHPTILSKKG